MPQRRIRTLKGLLRAAVDEFLDRLLGDETPPLPELEPNRVYTMRRSVKIGGGVLLKGTAVRFTGARARNGEVEVKVVDIPDDYDWEPERRLPYGPGFVLFVPPDAFDLN